MLKVLVVAAALVASSIASAQEVALSFTREQVDRGRAVYDTTCVMCHGANFDDGPLAAPLKGDAFMRKYGGQPARALFDVLRTTMPTGNPGSLPAETYAALAALILEQNDIVAGSTPLPADPQLLAAMQVPAGGFSFMAFSPYSARPAVDRATPLATFNPVTDDSTAAPPAGDWLGWRRSYDAQGFSPLSEIDTRNVENLRLAWSWTLPAGSAESVPVVRDGTIFVQAYGDIVQALDAKTGDLLWQYTHTLEDGASPFHKRGLALSGNRL
jgi:alcohol dehydrogenase (cytochrome c)